MSHRGRVLGLCVQVAQCSSWLCALILVALPVTEVRVAKCLKGISSGIAQASTNSSSEAVGAVALQYLTLYPTSYMTE